MGRRDGEGGRCIIEEMLPGGVAGYGHMGNVGSGH